MFWENIRMALAAIWANKLRSSLTVIGIVIGVAVVIAVQGIIQGLTGIVINQIQGLGANTIQIQEFRPPGKEGEKLQRIELTVDDAEAIRHLCPDVVDMTYMAFSLAMVKRGDEHTSGTFVLGTTSSFQEVRNFYVERGRFFSSVDDSHRSRVCVLGDKIVEDLKIKGNPVGMTLQVAGQDFRVIGVMEKRGEVFGESFDRLVLIPHSTSWFLVGDKATKHISILLRASTTGRVDAAMDQVTDLLRRRHGLNADQPDDFQLLSQAQLMSAVRKVTDGLAIGAAVIVGFALLVASIGVTNIMLVSVTERTREIGIRKAIGAKRQNIMAQFLIEAVTLCCFGGAVGILTGLGLSLVGYGILNHLIPGWPPISIPLYVFVLGVVIPAFFGVIAGLWPAYRAARLDPIESLRYE